MTPEEQQMADHSWVEYWPYPYMAIEHCKGNPNGLGLENQGKEHTIEEIGEYDESKVKKVRLLSRKNINHLLTTHHSTHWSGSTL